MMGYLFLAIVLAEGTAKGYYGKKLSAYTQSLENALRISVFRMALCAATGLLLVAAQGNLHLLRPDAPTILCALWWAVGNSVCVILWLVCVRGDAYVLVEVFMTLSVPIAVFGSALIPALHERVAGKDVAGMLLLVAAAVIMQGYDRQLNRRKLTWKALAALAGIPLSSGLADLAQRFYIKTVSGAEAGVFSFYNFLLSALLLALGAAVRRGKGERLTAEEKKKALLYAAMMALLLFANSYFKTRAAALLDGAVLYPLVQCLSMLLGMGMSAFAFGEKPTRRACIGMAIAIMGVLVINFC